jgi:hypothetical protein
MKMRLLTLSLAAACWGPNALLAQFGPPQPNPVGRTNAPIDLTGTWVRLVTEDWRFLMVTPPKGDFPGMPLNQQGRQIAMNWDPDKDVRDGNACRAYGAAAIMRMPGRSRISWENDLTLKIELEAGTQTRRVFFGPNPPAAGAPSLQGYSIGTWEMQQARAPKRTGSLKVVTNNLQVGYIHRNGVPYSEKTTVTEYFDVFREDDGTQYMVVKTIIEDPGYLTGPVIKSSNSRKEASEANFKPNQCEAK